MFARCVSTIKMIFPGKNPLLMWRVTRTTKLLHFSMGFRTIFIVYNFTYIHSFIFVVRFEWRTENYFSRCLPTMFAFVVTIFGTSTFLFIITIEMCLYSKKNKESFWHWRWQWCSKWNFYGVPEQIHIRTRRVCLYARMKQFFHRKNMKWLWCWLAAFLCWSKSHLRICHIEMEKPAENGMCDKEWRMHACMSACFGYQTDIYLCLNYNCLFFEWKWTQQIPFFWGGIQLSAIFVLAQTDRHQKSSTSLQDNTIVHKFQKKKNLEIGQNFSHRHRYHHSFSFTWNEWEKEREESSYQTQSRIKNN